MTTDFEEIKILCSLLHGDPRLLLNLSTVSPRKLRLPIIFMNVLRVMQTDTFLAGLHFFLHFLTRPTFEIAVKYRVDPKAIGTPTLVKVNIVASSMDSDLEAFSHNPTDDSFAALATQPTALPNI